MTAQAEVAVRTDLVAPVLAKAATYLPAERLAFIEDAYRFAEQCHEGQVRKTGDPYITHPVAVTELVASLQLDHHALAAALLHDVQEDCGVANATIAKKFGPEVARLVDGLTKLDKISGQVMPGQLNDTTQAQNLRKMFLAMAEDVRVILVKLCDRLHNMRTLWPQPEEKQKRIARETLEVFAPIANRLGVWQLKWELEDLSFRYLQPEAYKEIAERVASRREERQQLIDNAVDVLRPKLQAAGMHPIISGRAKHVYSIYQKMHRYQRHAKGLDQIYDLSAIRVIVDTVEECYHALGMVHQLWRPIPGEFDDYIGNPKDSMYQSLHTTVLLPNGRPLEVQIRTHEMHLVAEYGVAAHWRYKEGGRGKNEDERIAWLRQLLDLQRDVPSADDFVETVKTDIFQDQVFVFTPKGRVLDLPAGATPLDFAYRIHTDLGHQTVGAKVNGKMVALNTALRTGDVVEIMGSASRKGPSRDWLNPNLGYVRTAHSLQKIRQWFRKQQRAENIERGREMLEKEMRRLGADYLDRQDELLQMMEYTNWEDFLAAIGYGGVSTTTIARKMSALLQEEQPDVPELPAGPAIPPTPTSGMRVLGIGNLLTTMARCCNPVPGDDIVGYVTRARGVAVHREDCLNILNEDEPERLVPVEWGTVSRLFPVSVRIEAWDRVGLLRDISGIITDEKVNMVGVRTMETPGGEGGVTILATLETTGIEQLSRLLSRLEIIRGVRSVERDGSAGRSPRKARQAAARS